MNYQKGIIGAIPDQARHLFHDLKPGGDPGPALQKLARFAAGNDMVCGLGYSLLQQLGIEVPGIHEMPQFKSAQQHIPANSHALWCWLRGKDRGALLHLCREVNALLADSFEPVLNIDAFNYDGGRDLTGYEDGTENPEGQAALETALVSCNDPNLDGGSFVAVQQWLHDLDAFGAMNKSQQDNVIGRERISNDEMDDAPPAAHVKRTAQEDFDPEAFVLRRSMPWSGDKGEGLVFVAFGRDFYAFEALLNNMLGNNDGITDNLFQISKPLNGAYFWCPPVKDGLLLI